MKARAAHVKTGTWRRYSVARRAFTEFVGVVYPSDPPPTPPYEEADVEEWFNISPIEQELMFAQDQAAIFYLVEIGFGESTAGDLDQRALDGWEHAKRSMPIYYGTHRRPPNMEGESRKLPSALKSRVNAARNRLAATGQESMAETLGEFPSFNAWVRHQISIGSL